MNDKTKTSLKSALVIFIISGSIYYFFLHDAKDKEGAALSMIFVILVAMGVALTLGTIFLAAVFLKIGSLKNSLVFNFISTLNILLGITGVCTFLMNGFEKPTFFLPFIASLLIGSLMFYRIDK